MPGGPFRVRLPPSAVKAVREDDRSWKSRASLVKTRHSTRRDPMDRTPPQLARTVARLSPLVLPGAGQVTVAGDYAYVGHIPNKRRLGTSILDVADVGVIPRHGYL